MRSNRFLLEEGIPLPLLGAVLVFFAEPWQSRTMVLDVAVLAFCVFMGVFAGVCLAAWLLFLRTRAETSNLQSDLASLKRFQQLFFDQSPVGFFRTDRAGNCLFVNHKWREMTGYSLEEALGRGWARVVYPGDSHRVYSEWRDVYSGLKNFDCRFRYLNKNGSVFWVWGHAAPFYDEQGELIEYFGSVVDISGMVEVSELLHQRERDLESILTSLEDVVFELNEQNVITNFWTNDRGLLFRRPEEFLGKPIWRELGEVGQKIEQGFSKF
ncbi:MAG: PAS domain-containing protein [Bdellovibrio sp.]